MKRWPSVVLAAILVGMASGVAAAPPGQDVQWTTPMGVVTFSGQAHADAGSQCTECHDMAGGGGGTFQMKQGTAKQKMAEMNEGKGCGTCHNGEKAFSTADAANCAKCHKM